MDGDYAISWVREYGKGKVFYTSFGHRREVWKDERFQKHLFGGLTWAHGTAPPAMPRRARASNVASLLWPAIARPHSHHTWQPFPCQQAANSRELLQQGSVLVPGVFCPLVARMAERIGFKAVYLSGGALSAATGVPDIGLVTLSEFVAEAQRITLATKLPLISDADTGFGEALNVERTVKLLKRRVSPGSIWKIRCSPSAAGISPARG